MYRVKLVPGMKYAVYVYKYDGTLYASGDFENEQKARSYLVEWMKQEGEYYWIEDGVISLNEEGFEILKYTEIGKIP